MTLSIKDSQGNELTQEELDLITPILNDHMQGKIGKVEFKRKVEQELKTYREKNKDV